MADRQFETPELARLYDPVCGTTDRQDFGFHLPLVLESDAVLDVGCGTGSLLHLARHRGHTGRLVGIDPAHAMLDVARSRSDIDWVHGDMSSYRPGPAFDLVVMTGHAFQALVTDAEIAVTLDGIHAALRPGGRFSFETRNPAARAWERWVEGYEIAFVAAGGRAGRFRSRTDEVDDGVVSFTTSHHVDGWTEAESSTSMLRFLDADALDRALSHAGFTVQQRYGDWDRSAFEQPSPEIITIAAASSPSGWTSSVR